MLDGQVIDAQCVTYFVNHMIAIRPMGPCCEFLLATVSDGTVAAFAELRLIVPRDFAMKSATSTLEFLRASLSPTQIGLNLSRLMC